MNRRETILVLAALGAFPVAAVGQPARVYRIGVIHHGGIYLSVIDGLRDGLKALRFNEEKQYILHLRDAKGDLKAVETLAKSLESEKVDLIFSVTTSATRAAKDATKNVRIVFYAGGDPVTAGLVEQFRRPGGRLTGIYGRFTDLTAKRIELLKEISPKARRFVTFFNPGNPGLGGVLQAREAVQRLKLELIERPVTSVEELRAGLRALRTGEADAFAYMADPLVISQTDLIIETALRKKLLTMFADSSSVEKGGLASYGQSYFKIGQLAAKLVQSVLLGADPATMPVEQLDQIHFAINLRTAKALGLTISPAVMARVDEVFR